MKFINREYGFQGRPPYFSGYYEKKSKGPDASLFKFPKIGTAGYGLHFAIPNSVLLAGKNGTMWGAKMSYQKTGRKAVDTEDFMESPGDFFAESKDGKFSYFNHGDISASVVRYSPSSVVVVISSMGKVKVKIDYYPIEPHGAELVSADINEVKGASSGRAVIPGTVRLKDFDMEIRDRYSVEFEPGDEDEKKEYFYAKSYFPADDAKKIDTKKAFGEYYLDNKASRIVLFLCVSQELLAEGDIPTLEEINNGVSIEELIYTAEKVMGSGPLGSNAANIISRCNFNRIYDPYLNAELLVEDRRKCNQYCSYDSTELARGALVYALTGEYESAMKQLELCSTDYILGAMTAWIVYCRTRNQRFLEKTLQKFFAEMEINGNLVVADKMTLREIAYKQTGSPLKDIKNEDVYSLDMSCYKLIYLDVLSRMAVICKNKSADMLLNAKNALKEHINRELFNEKLGLYMDRYLSGEFVGLYTANTFLPITAGVITDMGRLEKLLIHLKDEKEFGGRYMVPTLPRNHPLYGKMPEDADTEKSASRGYRGLVDPTLNFLIYLGLKRYGVSTLESELSSNSVRLYNETLERYGKTPNFYISSKIQRKTETVKNSLSGNLMGLIGVTEMLDVEYFREDLRPALCFGALADGDNRLANVELLGHRFSISISDDETLLMMDGSEIFKGSGGKFVVRQFTESAKGTEFVILAKQDTTLTVMLSIFTRGNENKTPIVFNVEKGKTKVFINRRHKVETVKMAD